MFEIKHIEHNFCTACKNPAAYPCKHIFLDDLSLCHECARLYMRCRKTVKNEGTPVVDPNASTKKK